MSKITTPLQALEEIRAVCWSEARRENVTSATFEMLRRQVAELAMDGMRSAAEPAGLTPAQAAADKLLCYARRLYESEGVDGREPMLSELGHKNLGLLLDELDPPKPPTLDDALAVLRQLDRDSKGWPATEGGALDNARKLLKRVPN